MLKRVEFNFGRFNE